MKKHVLPNLRFTSFVQNWHESRLGRICSNFKSGSTITSASIDETNDYPVFGGNGLRGYTSSYTHDGRYVLIGRQGALCGNINEVQGKSFISEHAIVIGDNEYSDIGWLKHKLTQMNLNRYSESSAQPGLSVGRLKRLKVFHPDPEEQQQISDFLTSVDTKVSQLKEKKRLLKEYKKGVMQQIFSQKIRFKDEDGKEFPEWTYESIGKYLEPYKELVRADTDIPILTSSRTGLYLQERSVINEGDYGVVPLGHFTYRHMSDDLIFKFNVNRTWEKGAVSKEYPVFKVVGMDAYFLETQLNEGNDFKRFAIQQKQGGTRTRLYFKNLKELKLNLPSLKEQQRISLFLQSIDTKIEGVAEQIEQTKQFKKGLLQQMFV